MLGNAPIRAYIPAADVKRARKFYEEIVGLIPKQEYAGGVIYECGGAEVFMYPTSNAGTSKASQAYWQVDDLEAEVAELRARGVKFEEYDMPGVTMKNSVATGGGAKTAWFQGHRGKYSGGEPTPYRQRGGHKECCFFTSVIGSRDRDSSRLSVIPKKSPCARCLETMTWYRPPNLQPPTGHREIITSYSRLTPDDPRKEA